jgi:hypothetical protein
VQALRPADLGDSRDRAARDAHAAAHMVLGVPRCHASSGDVGQGASAAARAVALGDGVAELAQLRRAMVAPELEARTYEHRPRSERARRPSAGRCSPACIAASRTKPRMHGTHRHASPEHLLVHLDRESSACALQLSGWPRDGRVAMRGGPDAGPRCSPTAAKRRSVSTPSACRAARALAWPSCGSHGQCTAWRVTRSRPFPASSPQTTWLRRLGRAHTAPRRAGARAACSRRPRCRRSTRDPAR